MKENSKGISLDYASTYYDIITPAEKSRFRRKQIGLIDLRQGEKVLEVGCGTGALSLLAKQTVGETGEVTGLDIAPKMIARAKEKARKADLDIGFHVASIDEVPFPDEYFHVVISSMMFHHLPIDMKRKGLREVHRVLRKGGKLFLTDFCSPYWLATPIMYLMHVWISATRYQLLGKLPGLIRETGFNEVRLLKKGFFLEYHLAAK
jgi:ubiquinone/menaquinone biosynthesis C-methylase UbiE